MSKQKKEVVKVKEMPELPAGFGTTEALAPGSGGGGDYMAFLDPRSESFAEVSAVGVKPDEPYARIGGEYRSLVGVQMHLLAGYGYWSESDEKGRPAGPKYRDSPTTTPGTRPKEFAEVLFLAYLDRTTPIPATLRSATCQILRQARDAIRATEIPNWAGDDPVRSALAKIAPVLRVVGTLRAEKRPSKTTGYDYRVGFFTPTIIPMSLVPRLAAWNGTPEYAAALAMSQAVMADAARLQ